MVSATSATRRYVPNLHCIMRIDHKWPQATSDFAGGSVLSWSLMRNGKPLAELQMMD